jgi:hypothetical protein
VVGPIAADSREIIGLPNGAFAIHIMSTDAGIVVDVRDLEPPYKPLGLKHGPPLPLRPVYFII